MILECLDRGDGPVVVLLHGFPFDRSLWDEQVDALSGPYRVIVPDLRGHGTSAVVPGVATVEAMAADVLETLNDRGVQGQVVLGGLSMGGYVALALAVDHPARLRGLMLINSRAAADTPLTREVRATLVEKVLADGHPGAVVETMLPKLFAPGRFETRGPEVAAIEAVMRRSPVEGVAAALRGLAARPDRTADLPRIALPTLVVAGTDDQLIPLAESRAMAESVPGARFIAVNGAGHLAPLERPIEVNQAIGDFLASLGPAS